MNKHYSLAVLCTLYLSFSMHGMEIDIPANPFEQIPPEITNMIAKYLEKWDEKNEKEKSEEFLKSAPRHLKNPTIVKNSKLVKINGLHIALMHNPQNNNYCLQTSQCINNTWSSGNIELNIQSFYPEKLALSSNHSHYIFLGRDPNDQSTIVVFDPNTLLEKNRLPITEPINNVNALAVSNDGNQIAYLARQSRDPKLWTYTLVHCNLSENTHESFENFSTYDYYDANQAILFNKFNNKVALVSLDSQEKQPIIAQLNNSNKELLTLEKILLRYTVCKELRPNTNHE